MQPFNSAELFKLKKNLAWSRIDGRDQYLQQIFVANNCSVKKISKEMEIAKGIFAYCVGVAQRASIDKQMFQLIANKILNDRRNG